MIQRTDYADLETCITKLRERLAVAECVCKGFNRSNSHVFSHDYGHTWLRYWMDYAHVLACDWRSVLMETNTEVFLPGRDYVLWKGNLPWQSGTLLSDSQSTTTRQENLLVALIQKRIRNSHHHDQGPSPSSKLAVLLSLQQLEMLKKSHVSSQPSGSTEMTWYPAVQKFYLVEIMLIIT